jgi:hypothetical protein
VRVLGVDSVTEDEVIRSVSGGPKDEGPGKGDGSYRPCSGPEGTLNMDSGIWVSLAIVINSL